MNSVSKLRQDAVYIKRGANGVKEELAFTLIDDSIVKKNFIVEEL